MKIVFDTSAWIEYFEGSSKGKTVDKYLKESEVITPSIALLELSYKADKKGWDIRKHLNFIKLKSTIAGINESFVLNFGRIYNQSKKEIRDFSLADAVILTTSKIHKAKILTEDSHFSSFDNSIII
ncbi:PIN domain-containing protein [Candidatus Pacearchaeota archaeon]|nr:PIN domain-containing protein [Candidatus Pacearchaeota archaeon]